MAALPVWRHKWRKLKPRESREIHILYIYNSLWQGYKHRSHLELIINKFELRIWRQTWKKNEKEKWSFQTKRIIFWVEKNMLKGRLNVRNLFSFIRWEMEAIEMLRCSCTCGRQRRGCWETAWEVLWVEWCLHHWPTAGNLSSCPPCQ